MRKIQGGCHCGAIQYQAEISFDEPTFRCNCSVCTKARAWILPLEPERLMILRGLESASVYTFGMGGIEHVFCARCGVKTFGRTNDKSPMHPLVVVNVATLELQPAEFMEFNVSYMDGLHDSQDAPSLTSYL